MTRLLMGAMAALFLCCTPGSILPAEPLAPASLTDSPAGGLTDDLASHLGTVPGPGHPLAGYEAHFLITWQGARIGDATEILRARGADALRFERRERIIVRRGDALAHSETLLVIDTDAALRARRVAIRHMSSGVVRRGQARRNRRGDWLVTSADEPARLVPGNAVPAELVPLLLAAGRAQDAGRAASTPDTAFDGPVLLAGYGFATAHLRVRPADEHTLIATLSTPAGALRGRFSLGQSGTVVRVRSDDGTGALRVDAAAAAAPFTPPELVDAASVPLEHRPVCLTERKTEPAVGPVGALVLEPIPAQRPLPPALPGQRIEARPDGWYVRLAPGDTGAVPAEEPAGTAASAPAATSQVTPAPAGDPALAHLAAKIIAESSPATTREEAFLLARAAATLLEDDLGAPAGGARTALAQGRGDCTAHSLLFAALTRARGIPTRLVTGYRLDRDRLVRHRWALVAVDGAWIAVDPTYGEAPAAPRLIGLAVHGPRTAELALADDLAFAGLAGVRAHPCPPPADTCAPGSASSQLLSDQPCARTRPRTR